MNKLNLFAQVTVLALLVSINSNTLSGQTLILQNGDKYIGSSLNEELTGRGKFIHYDEHKNVEYTYEGDLLKGIRHGNGTYTWSNGACYKGSFMYGLMSGIGEMLFENGNRYKGPFINGIIIGKGEMLFANGDRYVGYFFNGMPNGEGEITYANGDTYKGGFINGVWNGIGRLTRKDGTFFEGNFIGGKLLGLNGEEELSLDNEELIDNEGL